MNENIGFLFNESYLVFDLYARLKAGYIILPIAKNQYPNTWESRHMHKITHLCKFGLNLYIEVADKVMRG